MGVHVSVGYVPQSGIVGSWGMSIHPYAMFDTECTDSPSCFVSVSLVLSKVAPVIGMPTEKVPVPTVVLPAAHRALELQGSRWGEGQPRA